MQEVPSHSFRDLKRRLFLKQMICKSDNKSEKQALIQTETRLQM